MMKYFIRSQGVQKEIVDREGIENLTVELTAELNKLHRTEVPMCLNQGFDYGSNYITFGYWDPFGENQRNPFMDTAVLRKANIVREGSRISEVITYKVFHGHDLHRKTICSETEGEPEDCWIKTEYDLMKERCP